MTSVGIQCRVHNYVLGMKIGDFGRNLSTQPHIIAGSKVSHQFISVPEMLDGVQRSFRHSRLYYNYMFMQLISEY